MKTTSYKPLSLRVLLCLVLLFAILTLAFALRTTPAGSPASAVPDGDSWIGETGFNYADDTASAPGWTWDGVTKTLTLSGVNAENATRGHGIYLNAGSDTVTILLEGTNKVYTAQAGYSGLCIGGLGTTVIKGSGTLDAIATQSNDGENASNGITMETGTLRIDSGYVKANSESNALTSEGAGVRAGALVINGGYLVVSGKYRGISADTLTLNKGAAVTSAKTAASVGSMTVNDGYFEAMNASQTGTADTADYGPGYALEVANDYTQFGGVIKLSSNEGSDGYAFHCGVLSTFSGGVAIMTGPRTSETATAIKYGESSSICGEYGMKNWVAHLMGPITEGAINVPFSSKNGVVDGPGYTLPESPSTASTYFAAQPGAISIVIAKTIELPDVEDGAYNLDSAYIAPVNVLGGQGALYVPAADAYDINVTRGSYVESLKENFNIARGAIVADSSALVVNATLVTTTYAHDYYSCYTQSITVAKNATLYSLNRFAPTTGNNAGTAVLSSNIYNEGVMIAEASKEGFLIASSSGSFEFKGGYACAISSKTGSAIRVEGTTKLLDGYVTAVSLNAGATTASFKAGLNWSVGKSKNCALTACQNSTAVSTIFNGEQGNFTEGTMLGAAEHFSPYSAVSREVYNSPYYAYVIAGATEQTLAKVIIYIPDTTNSVTFDANNGKFADNSLFKIAKADEETAKVTLPENPTFGDYVFEGWSYDDGGTKTDFTADTTVDESLTVFAKWSYNGKLVKDTLLDLRGSADIDNTDTEGWKWTSSTSTLTLNGFTIYTPSSFALMLDSDSTIELAEGSENTLRGKSTVLTYEGGTLTIGGAGALNIIALDEDTTSSSSGAYAYGIRNTTGNLVINNNAVVTIQAGNTAANYGESKSAAIDVVELQIDSAVLYAHGGTATSSGTYESYGVKGDITLTNGGAIIASGNTAATKQAPTIEDNTIVLTNTTPTAGTGSYVPEQIGTYKWLSISTAKTITFNANGGKFAADATTTSGTADSQNKVTLPASPTRAGFIFSGWNTLANGTGSAVTADTVYTTDKTVYAVWTATVLENPTAGVKIESEEGITSTGTLSVEKTEAEADKKSTVKSELGNEYEIKANYDFSIVDGDSEVPFAGSVTVTLAPPAGMSTADVKKVVSFNGEGAMTVHDFNVQGGNIVFTMESIGNCALVGNASVNVGGGTTPGGTTPGKGDANSPDGLSGGAIAGIVIGVFFFLFIIAFVVLYVLWKKKDVKLLAFLVPLYRKINELLFKTELNDVELKEQEKEVEQSAVESEPEVDGPVFPDESNE